MTCSAAASTSSASGGQLLAHIQNTHHQYNLPEPSRKIIYKVNRPGVAERFTDPAAREQDPEGFHLLKTIPGIGNILGLTILYEVHDITRVPRVQQFAS